MASKVSLTLTYGQDHASLIVLDPIGPNNTWSCDPPGFLSQPAGSWTQGLGSQPVVLSDSKDKYVVLQFEDLNMFDPQHCPQSGSALASGDGGTVLDMQTVDSKIDKVE